MRSVKVDNKGAKMHLSKQEYEVLKEAGQKINADLITLLGMRQRCYEQIAYFRKHLNDPDFNTAQTYLIINSLEYILHGDKKGRVLGMRNNG